MTEQDRTSSQSPVQLVHELGMSLFNPFLSNEENARRARRAEAHLQSLLRALEVMQPRPHYLACECAVLRRERDAARAEVDTLARDIVARVSERDEWRSKAERLSGLLALICEEDRR